MDRKDALESLAVARNASHRGCRAKEIRAEIRAENSRALPGFANWFSGGATIVRQPNSPLKALGTTEDSDFFLFLSGSQWLQ